MPLIGCVKKALWCGKLFLYCHLRLTATALGQQVAVLMVEEKRISPLRGSR
jgi:hypothetical protein